MSQDHESPKTNSCPNGRVQWHLDLTAGTTTAGICASELLTEVRIAVS
jgi:hypothetical protein